MMFRWLTMTPFGADVEPEVYCKKARESSFTLGADQRCSASSGSVSVGVMGRAFEGVCSSSHAAILPCARVFVKMNFGCAS